jgi:3-deoxy-manno-octulosonate cytidylyltransferase (CMP-KDO synthetase)
MQNDFLVVIPARMNSTRLPRKMLLEIGGGVPLIVYTAQQALRSAAKRVIIATDHQEIFTICKNHHLDVVMTANTHHSGSDRLCEVAQQLRLNPDEIIINVQGDEPLINPQLINQLAQFIYSKQAECATIAYPLSTITEVFNPNIVKLVLDHRSYALYFSRAPIPYYRDSYPLLEANRSLPQQLQVLRHIGIYAYRVGFLRQYHQLAPSPLEQVEALEQLRILYHGYSIAVMHSKEALGHGVDTMEDLIRVREIISNHV